MIYAFKLRYLDLPAFTERCNQLTDTWSKATVKEVVNTGEGQCIAVVESEASSTSYIMSELSKIAEGEP